MTPETYNLNLSPNYRNGIIVDHISHKNPYDFRQLHRHNYYELLIFNNSEGGCQVIDFNTYPIEKQTLYILKPGQVHLMNNKKNETGIAIQFTEEFIHHYLPTLSKKWIVSLNSLLDVRLSDTEHMVLIEIINKLLFYFKTNTDYAFKKLSYYVGLFLTEVIEISDHPSRVGINVNQKADQFMSAVKQHVSQKRNVQEYASMLNISTTSLTQQVKDSFGKTPKQIILDHLLLEVKRIMIFQKYSHKEIAHLLNFDSQNSYNKFIKDQTSLTPSKLRCELIENHKL